MTALLLSIWLLANYALMARLTFVALRRDGLDGRAATAGAFTWPVLLLGRRAA